MHEDWPMIWDTIPKPREAAYYFGPIYRECRAYARIIERGIQDRFWQCYGYLRFPHQLRERLYDVTGLPAHYWQVRPPELDDRTDKPTLTIVEQLKWPIYGLVKEIASSFAAELDPRQRPFRVMLTDLKRLHTAGVVNTDIAGRNYIAGRLIDFSHSYTLPHIWFSKPRKQSSYQSSYYRASDFDAEALGDRLGLRNMIVKSKIKTKVVQAVPDDGCIAFRTRARRAARLKWSDPLSPLYELGVQEPKSRRRYRCDSFSDHYSSDFSV